ncbi:MAG TPA: Hsp70 family protein [Microbacterium sp.]|uniref:Hsp70 family protein n=1 Tax=Microbacterium sp. TaxID=51671 RepID=UPI002BD3AB0B|nr:Hsp70 family protein [Microbacterium sp.]HWI31685.1 Hsp70 family protein [Microbacterium sp.]
MTKQYFLAIDVGTSRTAAAVARPSPEGTLQAVSFPLGRTSDSAPSAIFVTDSELLFGDAAERRGLTQPERMLRECKRRIGDEVPIVAGDRRFSPEELYALTVAWVVDVVSEREGHSPAAICVTVPVTWGRYRCELIESALARHDFAGVRLIPEPEAAARHYESTNPMIPGSAIAVYDLGGGTFDAVVLRKEENGEVRTIGDPVGLSDFGGVDFDDAVLAHAVEAAGLSASALASDDSARVALAALRRECVDAKESLSFDSEAVVPVLLGDHHGTVRLTRSEFEEMIEVGVDRTIDVFADALERSGVAVDDVAAILLTGGSSRIPLIAQLLSERFDRPIAVDADPKAIIALGAARATAEASLSSAPVPVSAPTDAVAAVERTAEDETTTALRMLFGAGAGVDAPREDDTASTRRKRRFRALPVAVVAGGALALISGVVISGATGMSRVDPPSAADQVAPLSLLDFHASLYEESTVLATADVPIGTEDALQPVTPPENQTDRGTQPRVKTTNPRVPVRAEAEAPKKSSSAPLAPSSSSANPSTGSAPHSPTTAGTGDTPAAQPPAQPPATTPDPAPAETPPPPPETTPDPEPEPTVSESPPPDADPGPEPSTEPSEPATPPDPAPSPTGEPELS